VGLSELDEGCLWDGVTMELKLLIKLKSKQSYNYGREGCLDIFVLFEVLEQLLLN